MTLTLKRAALAGGACLIAGLIAGRYWQGRAASAAYDRLAQAYTAHLRADSAASRVDAARADTVTVYRVAANRHGAAADSMGRLLDAARSRIREQIGDSARTVFDAWMRTVVAREAARLAQIADLSRVVATQDTIISGLRFRLNASNALLADVMATARASRRWHLVVFGGYGVNAPIPAGTVSTGGQIGIGIAYTLW